MADINATKAVTAPAVGSVTYDKWFMTQIIGKFDGTSGQTIIKLRRAAKEGDKWLLMPNSTSDAEVSFTLDVFKEMANTPELAAAMATVTAAVTAYASKKNLL
jgi:transposase